MTYKSNQNYIQYIFTEAKDTAAHDYQNIDNKAYKGSIKITSSSKVCIHMYVCSHRYVHTHLAITRIW